MIVYRQKERRIDPRALLSALNEAKRTTPTYDDLVSLVIQLGDVEVAIADGSSPEFDAITPITGVLRAASVQLGHALARLWRGETHLARAALDRVTLPLASELPAELYASVAKGYAYYGLYPEMYIEAAKRFFLATRANHVVCIGVRSIGASLSGVVAATLEQEGCSVWSLTVRPRGQPLHRHIAIGPSLSEELERRRDQQFLIVSGGPGVSGSSFASVSYGLGRLGVPSENIVYLPSWIPDASNLCSAEARLAWRRHRKYGVSLEEAWFTKGRFDASMIDVSAGRWRERWLGGEGRWPAVAPQHERRKFIVGDVKENPAKRLLKFCGLGPYGESKRDRAQLLSAAGYTTPMVKLQRGFLESELVDGVPLERADFSVAVANRMVNYVTFLRSVKTRVVQTPFDSVMEMIRVNVREALGDAWASRTERLLQLRAAVGDAVPSAVDGRMQPHEWLRARGTLFKTDALDHEDDHVSPGCSDSAWDLAGLCAEWQLDSDDESMIVDEYARSSKDAAITVRLPFFHVAYLAHRMGYVAVVGQAAARGEASRWKGLSREYGRRLKRHLFQL